MFSAYRMGSHIVYICCVQFQTFRLINSSVFNILTNVFFEIIQSVSRLVDITAGGDFLGLCDQKMSYKHLSDFGRLRSYDRLKLRKEGNDY